jgi:energy-coupling factor transporter ATP-binding protein EcfA2
MNNQQDSGKPFFLIKRRKYFYEVYAKYHFSVILKYAIIALTVTCLIDMINYPTQLIKKYGLTISLFFGIIAFLLIVIITNEKHLLDWRKISAINIYDCILQVVIWSTILYFITIIIFSMIVPYKLIILGGVLLISLYSTYKRGRCYKAAQKAAEVYESNIVDLKELYENHIRTTTGTILLDERDVDYDLLNRKSIINHLANIIITSKPQGKFVISLEGKWGSGKTTILRNVKKIIEESNENIVIIDDFDPWTYGTEESIVENFFSCIVKRNDLKLNTTEIKRSVSILTNAIIDSPDKTNLLYSIILGNRNVDDSKKQINEYIKLCEKRIVIYIDNLDRVEDEKIVFIFKLIGNVLDFDKVTYIISFDNEKVKKIFDTNLNIDYDYIKKIVQMQIKVPEVDGAAMGHLVRVCTSNLIALYIKSDKEKGEYNEFITFISKFLKDIRDFKRFINSIVIKTLTDSSNLSKRDKLIIEYIRMNNYELYRTIYNNRKYFVSEDTMYDKDLWETAFSREEFNQEAKDFFRSLFSNAYNLEFKEILGTLFPYVAKYIKGQELRSQYSYGSQSELQRIARRRGISSAKFFDLYFSETENQFSVLGGFIENFIDLINRERESVHQEIEDILHVLQPSMHKELIEGLQLYISDISSQSVYILLSTLFNNIWKIDNSSIFLGLSARSRCNVINWELIQKLSDNEFEDFLKEVENQYDKIEIINSVSYWFENDNESKNVAGRLEQWKETENKLVSEIIDRDIDLYADEFYNQHNIWGLYRNLIDEVAVFQDYIKKRINKKNIFRILYDTVGHSFGTEHVYYLHSGNLKLFFDQEELNDLMKDIVAETEDEKFLIKLYEKYLQYPNDEIGHKTGIVFNEEKILHL